MNKLFTSIILALFVPVQLYSQSPCTHDFVTKLFNVQIERDVVYGTDTAYNGNISTLRMNIFKPENDSNTLRPCLILIHGGAFYTGTKEEFDTMCYWYAQRGYVAATISYRLGMYAPWFLSNPYVYDTSEVIRAGYRGVQDAKGAIRFLKGRNAQDSSDINMVFVGGASAGAIAALHVAYFDKPSEKPFDAGAIGPVIHGANSYPRPDLGDIEGKLNMNGFDASVKAVASYFGALLDTSLVESSSDPGMYLYHQTGDPIVGCDFKKGLYGAPLGIGANYPHLYGSCIIDDRAINLGYSSKHFQTFIYNGNTHGVHDVVLVDSLVAEFLSDYVCPAAAAVAEIGKSEMQLEVFPNPADKSVVISLPIAAGTSLKSTALDVKILDELGRIVFQSAIRNQKSEIDISMLHQGIYFVTLQTSTEKQMTKLIVY